jgi:signal transduction histidine kinase
VGAAPRALADGTHGVACYFHDVTRCIQAAGAIGRDGRSRRVPRCVRGRGAPAHRRAGHHALAAELLGKHVAANQVLYAEIDTDARVGAVVHEWSDEHGALVTGAQTLASVHPTSSPSCERAHGRRRGRAHRADGGPLETYERRSVRSFVAVPLVKDDRFVACSACMQRTPRSGCARRSALVRGGRRANVVRRRTAPREAALREPTSVCSWRSTRRTWARSSGTRRRTAPSPMPRMLELFGLPPDGTINLAVALAQLIHPDDRQRYANAVGRAMDPSGDGRLREDIRVMRPTANVGSRSPARMEFAGEPRVPSRLVGMATDVTDRKRVEEALREREERLAESDRKKDEFLAILAHELRNPLAPIRTGVEVIRRAGVVSGHASRVTEMMERQIGHMVRLIDDLLDISRITSGKIRLQRQSSELACIVDSAVEANRAAIASGAIPAFGRSPHRARSGSTSIPRASSRSCRTSSTTP